MADFDVILVGGGLANGFIANRLAERRPELRVLVLEAGARLGGNHTWCFHASDVTTTQDAWLAPFTHARWQDQQVRFPAFTRDLETGYRAITSDQLHDRVVAGCSLQVMALTRASAVEVDAVTLPGGQTLRAPCVIDGRGLQSVAGVALGYQKFVGLEVELAAPHGLVRPIIMDATVAQIDGYRFLYALPFSPTRVLIEDTYYSDEPALDVDLIVGRVRAYATASGWDIASVARVETGVLPIPLDATPEAFWPSAVAGLARVGMRSGLFHQTTGYSLPLAAATADAIAGLPELKTAAVAALVRDTSIRVWREQAFFRLLNRLLFVSARPHERRDVFQRFYRLSHGLIERFYAGRLTAYDKVRILSGRPPIPIHRALAGMAPSSARDRRSPEPPAAAPRSVGAVQPTGRNEAGRNHG